MAAGPAVAELLRRCPGVSCLVTTRIPLQVSGEQQYPVPGLPAPPDAARLSEVDRQNLPRELREFDPEALQAFEAVRLFIARAAAIRPGFTVTNANAPAVAGIAARLHGMPLAIELAAARIKLLTPDQILARLEHHLAVLTAGSRDLPERQQTLRGAIAWSYDLLDEGARRLLDRLSTFRGGFTLELAETVCGPADEIGGDIVERIGELVDQSLVRLDDERADRRRAAVRDARDDPRVRGRDARGPGRDATPSPSATPTAMLAVVREAQPHLRGDDQRAWLDRLEREHDNIRAALDWATARPAPTLAVRLGAAMWRFWQQRGYLNEARPRLERMAEQDWQLDPVDRARFAEAIGGVAYWQSDRPTAIRWYDEALAIWEEHRRPARDRQRPVQPGLRGHDRGHARARPTRVAMATSRADMERALAIYQELGDTSGEGNLLWGLGSFHFFAGDAATRRVAGTSARWRCIGRPATTRWRPGRCTCWPWRRPASRTGTTPGRTPATPSATSTRRATSRASTSSWTTWRSSPSPTATRTGPAACGARRASSRPRPGRPWPTTSRTRSCSAVETPEDRIEPERLARLSAEGAAMPLDELVAYALGSDDGPLPEHHAEEAERP